MNIEQMIEDGILIPAADDLERGKAYVSQILHDNDCPYPDDRSECTCAEVAVSLYEYLPEGTN